MSYGDVWGTEGVLVGRDADLARVRASLATPARGRVLLLTGAPGAGTSVFLDAIAEAAAAEGTRVLRTAGAESESCVAHSALHQLLLPLRDTFDALGDVQREAVLVALGTQQGPPPDRLVLSNAVLVLLQTVAEASPVLLLVDDAARIDPASAAVLCFAARRLAGTRISLLGAVRKDAETLFDGAGLPLYELPPLDAESAARLLDARHPGLAADARLRVLRAAQGNPLLLVELPTALRAGQRTASDALPDVLPLPERLRGLLVPRIRRLPTATRRVLTLAALEGTGDLAVLHASVRHLDAGLDLGDLCPAERDDLVRVDDGARRLVFLHPLVPSAVVETVTSGERRLAHRALAAVLADRPERRARHLGQSLLEPDEQVAAMLESTADTMTRRGDATGAVTALGRSADLSPRRADRARRLAEAAHTAAVAGSFSRAAELADRARRADEYGPALRCATADAHLLLHADGDVLGAHRTLVTAIISARRSLDAGDAVLVDALHLLLVVCVSAGRRELWAPFTGAVDALGSGAPALLRLARLAFAGPVTGEVPAHRRLESALDDLVGETDHGRTVAAATPSAYLGRVPDLRASAWRTVRKARDGGGAGQHIDGLAYLCLDGYHTGRWDEVTDLAREGAEVCEAFGHALRARHFDFHLALVAAARGDADTARALADRMAGWAAPRDVRAVLDQAEHVRALADLGSGDTHGAYAHATAVSPAGTLAPHAPHALWVALDLVEAATRAGREAEAVRHARALAESRVERFSPRLALVARGAAALSAADDRRARKLFERALGVPGADRWPFDQARVQLGYGERLLEAGETAGARACLGAALKTFVRLGARPWAERTQRSLRTAGSAAPPPTGRVCAGLTPQEYEIAMLAASGLRNKEIAARMFISHRTVGAHLYQIFPKLGISSRAALRDALAARTYGDAPVAADARMR